MNFSTPAPAESTPAQQIESLRDWWSLAGVDLHYNSEPGPLLNETVPEATSSEPKPVKTIAPTEIKPQSVVESSQPQNISDDYPEQHDEFLTWLSSPENLIEAKWSQNLIVPTGMVEPEIMTVVAMPEQSGSAQKPLFSEKTSALLVNMLKAIGCDSEKTYFASVSLGRSFDGRIDRQYHDALKKRMLHHIALVRPKRIIFFGDTPSHLFFNENLLTARKNKQFVNHSSSKTEAIATFHPRILIERPEFKAEAWRDLQLLTRI